ncbi:MAG: GtrA family protein [Candidatus Moraniibacteriota bacterium]|nr:MAG: GtrA family protein [Candidatus Moranbacteria bacterium]
MSDVNLGSASPMTPAQEPMGLIARLVKQFSKFVIVGGINTGIDFAVLNVLIYLTGITKGWELFILNSISFSVAVVNSYYMNKRWTFKEAAAGIVDKNAAVQFSQFFIVSVIGITINGLILTGVTTLVAAPFGMSEQLWANFAKLFATGASLVWNFVGYKLFVFKK